MAQGAFDYRGSDLVDHSGTIAQLNASQQIMAANSQRSFLFFQNVSDTDMWINFGVAAVQGQPSILIVPGDSLTLAQWVSRLSLTVNCSVAGKPFTAKEG